MRFAVLFDSNKRFLYDVGVYDGNDGDDDDDEADVINCYYSSRSVPLEDALMRIFVLSFNFFGRSCRGWAISSARWRR